MSQIRRRRSSLMGWAAAAGAMMMMMMSFTSITLLIERVQAKPSTPVGGPYSEHGSQCNETWRPNLIEPLQKCSSTQANNECQKGYHCDGAGFCCPDKGTVCRMETDSGHESNAEPYKHIRRYAYDQTACSSDDDDCSSSFTLIILPPPPLPQPFTTTIIRLVAVLLRLFPPHLLSIKFPPITP
ncbi:hypothetical protein niasHT_014245 [Heterodera trifolii]|uniref:WAP domain-containing protein n=1 Tax=Heterodera trifolii TaxID=157864 RepID=A0ABD2KX63_9BILA